MEESRPEQYTFLNILRHPCSGVDGSGSKFSVRSGSDSIQL
jgi:hypothetical protein